VEKGDVVKRFRVPVATVDLSGNEEAYVADALHSSWIASTGPYVARFESDFAARIGAASVIAVTNGTVALHLAMLAMGIVSGDEVVVPAFAYIAVANACRYVGARPVFADVDPRTWCIAAPTIEAAITPRTKAVVVVHNYGHPADMNPILELTRARGLVVIEDAAEAFGALYRGRPVGSFGDVATFSFYANKIITSGEGGAVALRSRAQEAAIRQLRDHGMDPKRRYEFPVTGYNYRTTNVACAILCAQLERSEAILARRRACFQAYRDRLASVRGIGFQPVMDWATPAPWMFNVTVDAPAYGHTASELAGMLEEDGIETRPLFPSIHHQPPYRDEAARSGARLPVTDQVSASGLSLPSFTQLQRDSLEYVTSRVQRYSRRQSQHISKSV